MGRFVGFKNLAELVAAMKGLPEATLTLVGEGPMKGALETQIASLALGDRVRFLPPARGADKDKIFDDHDLLIIPSVTEISPNVVLEAASRGLPVLLTEETGYIASSAIWLSPLRTQEQIRTAVRQMISTIPAETLDIPVRDAGTVAGEWNDLLSSIS